MKRLSSHRAPSFLLSILIAFSAVSPALAGPKQGKIRSFMRAGSAKFNGFKAWSKEKYQAGLSQNQKLAATIAAIVATCGGSYYLMIRKISALKTDLLNLKNDLEATNTAITNVNFGGFQKTLDELGQTVNELTVKTINKQNGTSIINQVIEIKAQIEALQNVQVTDQRDQGQKLQKLPDSMSTTVETLLTRMKALEDSKAAVSELNKIIEQIDGLCSKVELEQAKDALEQAIDVEQKRINRLNEDQNAVLEDVNTINVEIDSLKEEIRKLGIAIEAAQSDIRVQEEQREREIQELADAEKARMEQLAQQLQREQQEKAAQEAARKKKEKEAKEQAEREAREKKQREQEEAARREQAEQEATRKEQERLAQEKKEQAAKKQAEQEATRKEQEQEEKAPKLLCRDMSQSEMNNPALAHQRRHNMESAPSASANTGGSVIKEEIKKMQIKSRQELAEQTFKINQQITVLRNNHTPHSVVVVSNTGSTMSASELTAIRDGNSRPAVTDSNASDESNDDDSANQELAQGNPRPAVTDNNASQESDDYMNFSQIVENGSGENNWGVESKPSDQLTPFQQDVVKKLKELLEQRENPSGVQIVDLVRSYYQDKDKEVNKDTVTNVRDFLLNRRQAIEGESDTDESTIEDSEF